MAGYAGTSGDDNIGGTDEADLFLMQDGGNDIVLGLGEDDIFGFGTTLNGSDVVWGNDGYDTITLTGGTGVLDHTDILNVEEIVLFGSGAASYNYTLGAYAADVGQTLRIDASDLGIGDGVIMDALAVLGRIEFIAGNSPSEVRGGLGNDYFDLRLSDWGQTRAYGASGDDVFELGDKLKYDMWEHSRFIHGQSGNDEVRISGDYSSWLDFEVADGLISWSRIREVETLRLGAGHDYNLYLSDLTVAPGQTLTVDATALGSGNAVGLDATREVDGQIILLGGEGSDTFWDGRGDDRADVGGGEDVIVFERPGADWARGGAGNDTFYFTSFFSADDTIDGGPGTDILNISGDYSASLTLGPTTLVNVEQIRLGAGNAYRITLNDGNVSAGATLTVDAESADRLTLNGATEVDGRIQVAGSAGNDVGRGGAGADKLNGNAGADQLWGNGGGDTLNGGAGNDIQNGGAANDTLIGGGGNDRMIGGAGNDTLNGTTGKDTLTGSAGKDHFVFKNALGSANVDSITDFNVADDTMRIDNAVMTKLGGTGTLAPARFHIGANAHDANDRIIYNAANGKLYYDPDGTGAAAQVQFAALDPGLALTAADFLVI